MEKIAVLVNFLAQRVVAAFAGERCFSAACGVIKIEIIEFVGFRRRNREVGVGPSARAPREPPSASAGNADRPTNSPGPLRRSPADSADKRRAVLRAAARIAARRLAFRRNAPPSSGWTPSNIVTSLNHNSVDQGRPRPAVGVRRSPAQDRADVVEAVKALPGGAVGLVPIAVRHVRMLRDPMVEIVFVQIIVHPDAVCHSTLWSSEPGSGVR